MFWPGGFILHVNMSRKTLEEIRMIESQPILLKRNNKFSIAHAIWHLYFI